MRVSCILNIFLITLISCTQPEYESPLDPASDNYVQPQDVATRNVVIVDFEGDSIRSVWGYEHQEFGLKGGNIIKTFTINSPDGKTDSRVMQLDYDVADSSLSQAIWFQLLGVINQDIGQFNARTMGLQSLSFYAKGDAGGEVFDIALQDVDGNTTNPSVRIELIAQWDKFQVPLSSLANGPVDLKTLTTLTVSFFHDSGSSKGKVFLDEIVFEWN